MKKKNALATAFQKLLQNKLATFCFVVMVIELILIIFAPLFTQYDPTEMDATIRLRPGFWAKDSGKYLEGHWLGTDELGRDVWSRLLYGGRVSLSVGFISTFIGITLGTMFGMLAHSLSGLFSAANVSSANTRSPSRNANTTAD